MRMAWKRIAAIALSAVLVLGIVGAKADVFADEAGEAVVVETTGTETTVEEEKAVVEEATPEAPAEEVIEETAAPDEVAEIAEEEVPSADKATSGHGWVWVLLFAAVAGITVAFFYLKNRNTAE